MAAKRLHDQSGSDPEKPEEKRLKTAPSFSTVIKEAMMVKSFQTICSALEPLLRRVVKEEVEIGIARVARTMYRSPSLKLESVAETSLQLIFTKKLSLPIFTGSKIQDVDNNALQIHLIDTRSGQPVTLPSTIKVEIVVLDGDFLGNDAEDWTPDEFKNNIVKAREGKRPLLTGDVLITLRDGVAVIEDLEFTDNSSWIRSRTFRLGAKVASGSSQEVRIKEAKTEPFQVKDHRGELYKKHYPPSLNDEVWRLERIGKDGAFHRKLAAEGINTVQQFLKMWVIDSAKLRRILGVGMSDKMWEGTMKHASTCEMGNKHYLYQRQHSGIVLNPVCQVVGAYIDGQMAPLHSLTGLHKNYVQRMAVEAFEKWDALEEVDEYVGANAFLRSDLMQVGTSEPRGLMNEPYGSLDMGYIIPSNNMQLDCAEWLVPASTPVGEGRMYTVDSASDDDSMSNANPRLLFYRES